MRLSGLRLTDLSDPAALRELVREPEGDRLERKREADTPTLVKTISGLANAAGGWLLLGVDDGGGVYGWQPKGRAHVRDWLRDKLDGRLDPEPPFTAELFEIDGVTVGVVHVPRSAQAPHYVEATGEVWQRRNGQTRRASAPRVRQMLERGSGDGRAEALARLEGRDACPDAAVVLDAPRKTTAMHERALASIVRVSLLETPDSLPRWVHSHEALQQTDTFLASAAQALNDRGLDWFDPPHVHPARTTAGGHGGSGVWDGRILKDVAVAFDGAGLAGVRFGGQRPDGSGVYYLMSLDARDRWVQIALAFLLGSLEQAGAYGPALVRWNLYGIRNADVMTVREDHVVLAQGVVPEHYDNMLSIDVDADVGATGAQDVAAELWRRLERLAGTTLHDHR